jgi:hypothetical protein
MAHVVEHLVNKREDLFCSSLSWFRIREPQCLWSLDSVSPSSQSHRPGLLVIGFLERKDHMKYKSSPPAPP